MPLDSVRRVARTVSLYGLGLWLLSLPVGMVFATAAGAAPQYKTYLLLLGTVTLLAGLAWVVLGLVAYGIRLGAGDDGAEPSVPDYY